MATRKSNKSAVLKKHPVARARTRKVDSSTPVTIHIHAPAANQGAPTYSRVSPWAQAITAIVVAGVAAWLKW